MACNMRACGRADGGGSERGASCSVEPARSERGTQAQRRGATPAATSAATRARAKWHARAHAPSDAQRARTCGARGAEAISRAAAICGGSARLLCSRRLLGVFGRELFWLSVTPAAASSTGLRHLSSAASPKAAAQGKRAAHAATPRAHTKPSNARGIEGRVFAPPSPQTINHASPGGGGGGANALRKSDTSRSASPCDTAFSGAGMKRLLAVALQSISASATS